MLKVYYNLHKHCWSIMGKSGRIIGHANDVVLDSCKFIVRPAGRRKVLEQKRKNVHAFVGGQMLVNYSSPPCHAIEVRYNPYVAGHFFKASDNTPVLTAKKVWLTAQRKVFAEL